MALKTVISASRRTDIPAFYMPWLMNCLELGYVETENPYNMRRSRVNLSPESVHSIVFWSKNYGSFLEGKYADRIKSMGLGMFFQFTINTPSPLLEPGVPALDQRLAQVSELAKIFGPEAVEWRFDPICFYADKRTRAIKNNLSGFETIAHFMAGVGIKRCVTSFLDIYSKLKKREKSGDFKFIDPDQVLKIEIIEYMVRTLKKLGMSLRFCCEPGLRFEIPSLGEIVSTGGCIDADLLMKIHGGNISKKQDKGQRAGKGCSCTESRDIGSYRTQPCFHRCLYCYAS